jgi:hypothetical protein
MLAALRTLFSSKRFIVSVLATAGAVFLFSRGQITAEQLSSVSAKIAMALTAAYAIENAAAAHGKGFPVPPDMSAFLSSIPKMFGVDPGPGSTASNTTDTTTPAESPAAKISESIPTKAAPK